MNNQTGPIFIVGCGRSGTTLLRVMLNNHSRIAIPGETWFFGRLLMLWGTFWWCPNTERKRRLFVEVLKQPTFGELGLDEASLRATIDSMRSWRASEVVSVANRAFAAKENKPRWGDKTPGYINRLRLIKHLFPNATVLHVIRDGRDVALSFLKAPFGPNSTASAATYWKKRVEEGQRKGPGLFGNQYMEIRYEELVDDPEGVLLRACQHVGEAYEPGMLEFHKKSGDYIQPEQYWLSSVRQKVSTDRVERWRREMSLEDREIFQNIAGDLLTSLGYSER